MNFRKSIYASEALFFVYVVSSKRFRKIYAPFVGPTAWALGVTERSYFRAAGSLFAFADSEPCCPFGLPADLSTSGRLSVKELPLHPI